MADAVLLAAARDMLDTRPGAALLLAKKAGVGVEARSLAEEAHRRATPPRAP
jgi:hypothetical protein